MSPMHEKRAALARTTLLHERNEQQDINPVESNTTRIPWSERLSIKLDGWQLIPFVLGHVAIVLSVMSSVWGGHGG